MAKGGLIMGSRVPVFSGAIRQLAKRKLGRVGQAVLNNQFLGLVTTSGKKLGVVIPLQEQIEWCWCATSLGVHKFFDPTDATTQCAAANGILGRDDACTDPANDQVNKPYYLDAALTWFHNLRQPAEAVPLDFPGVETEIDSGKPIGTRIGWGAGGGGHFMVIEGYGQDNESWVSIQDPIFGHSDMTYTAYCNAYQGTGTWTHTYRTKSHLVATSG